LLAHVQFWHWAELKFRQLQTRPSRNFLAADYRLISKLYLPSQKSVVPQELELSGECQLRLHELELLNTWHLALSVHIKALPSRAMKMDGFAVLISLSSSQTEI
jgi:hypothetical protein